MKTNHLLIIDGMALLFRSYFGSPPKSNKNGVPIHAVSGLYKHLNLALKRFQPSHVVVCWDEGPKTFRNELYSSYKENRQEPPEDLIPQFQLARELSHAMGLTNISSTNFEADDCIGTIVEQHKIPITILSGDRDLLQLLRENVTIAFLTNAFQPYIIYNQQRFIEEKAIQPAQLIEVKALMGDSTDHYPGAKGIGEKTAYSLIQQYGSIDEILIQKTNVSAKVIEKIERDIEMVRLSKVLATIRRDVPIQLSLDEMLLSNKEESLKFFLDEHGIKN